MKEVSGEVKRELYIKAQNAIKYAKLHKYKIEKDIISEEGVSFWGNFTGKNSLQYERIRNVKLRIELAHTQRIEEKTDYRIVDTLADMNSCVINEFNGRMPEAMKELYDDIRSNYCDDSVTDEYIYKLSCQKANKAESFLPVIHQEKPRGIFADRKAQIAFYRVENQKLEDLIVKERGKMQFETFSSKQYEIIKPTEKTIKINKNLDKVETT